jgi:hypothetical protein
VAPGPAPPGAGQGFGSPQQAYADQGYGQQGYGQAPPQYGQPGGAMMAPGQGVTPGLQPQDSNRVWLLSIVTFGIYALIWFHKTNKGLQEWSRGRIDYNAGSSLTAMTIGGMVIVPPLVATASYMGRIRTAQQMAGLPPQATFWGYLLRNYLFFFGIKWAQDQINEIAVRQPQG